MIQLRPQDIVPWTLALNFVLVLILGVSIIVNAGTVRALSKDVGECKVAWIEEAKRVDFLAQRITAMEAREKGKTR